MCSTYLLIDNFHNGVQITTLLVAPAHGIQQSMNIFFSDWISECILPVIIHFQPKNLVKILDAGKNYFKIPTGQVILILSNLSKKYSFSASIVIRTLAVIKTISGSSRWLGSWKRAIKHHRQEGIYIFHIINCIGIKRSFGGQEEQNPKNIERKT